MTKQTINIGSSANKGDGDPLRTAFTKINSNFTELYARAENTDSQTLTLTGNTLSISGGNSVTLNISPSGDLKGSVFADDSTILVDAVNGVIPYSVLSGAPTIPTDISQLTDTGNLIGSSNPFDQDLDTTDSPNFVNLGLAGTAEAGYATLSVTIDRDFYIGLNDTTTGATTFQLSRDGMLTVPGEVYGKFFSLRGGNLSGTIGTVGYGGDRVEISGLQGVGIVGGLDELSPIWDFGTDGNLTTPGDITVAGDITGTSGANTLVLKAQPNSGTAIQLNDTVDSIINTVANLEIRTDVSDTAKTWTFESDGTLTVPGTITSSDGFLYLGYDFSATPDVYIGAAGGGKVIRLESDRLQVLANPPTTSKGISGDNAGMLAFDNNYVYYCTAAHTDGLADIWKRVAWSGDTW